MFTGLIKETGTVKSLKRIGDGMELSVTSSVVNADAAVDDSIAVNGVCLTVVRKDSDSFTVQAVSETLEKSGTGSLIQGDKVNLEPALRADDRLGGHIVQGHIDGKGEIVRIIKKQNGKEFVIAADRNTLRYIVDKGSVCLDGVSLTVAGTDPDSFRVAVIPHTEKNTTIGIWKTGTKINIETDIIGRYVEKLLKSPGNGLTIDKLTQLGY
jgi:riboflavin synthase